jgi:hypothetical protein
LVEIVPTVVFPPATPSTLQLTPVFELPVTVAVYCDEVLSVTLVAPLNASVTVEPDPLPPGGGGGAARETARLCETLGSARLVAVIVTCEDGGSLSGAV